MSRDAISVMDKYATVYKYVHLRYTFDVYDLKLFMSPVLMHWYLSVNDGAALVKFWVQTI